MIKLVNTRDIIRGVRLCLPCVTKASDMLTSAQTKEPGNPTPSVRTPQREEPTPSRTPQSPSFTEWLTRQRGRDDYLGVIGYLVYRNPDWRCALARYAAFQHTLTKLNTSNVTEEAITDAYDDYQRWLSSQRGTPSDK